MKIEQQTAKYGGKTKRQYKKMKALTNSERGTEKGGTCVATALDKAMTRYPRAVKNYPGLYISTLKKKDKQSDRESYFTENY